MDKKRPVFFPLIFSKQMFDINLLLTSICGALSFSFLASVVYIINDIQDKEKDKLHSTKRERPIASGSVSVRQGVAIACILLFLAVAMNLAFSSMAGHKCTVILFIYLGVNLGYSCLGLKNIAILDIVLLVAGFFLRVLYGAAIIGVSISNWLYLTVIAGAFYMALGKRRNELRENGKGETRKVLKCYTTEFLDKNMYMCMSIAIVFYSLWCLDLSAIKKENSLSIVWTVPFALVLAVRYSYDIENENSDGDPVEVILKDKILFLLGVVYALVVIGIVYLG